MYLHEWIEEMISFCRNVKARVIEEIIMMELEEEEDDGQRA